MTGYVLIVEHLYGLYLLRCDTLIEALRFRRNPPEKTVSVTIEEQ